MRFFVGAVLAAGLMLVPATQASAQNQQEGLVNVAIEDVTVQVPISVAANICDVNVAVLVNAFADDAAACEATAESAASNGGGNGGGPPTTQEGLVNVLVDDVLVQVPVSVAANVCDVNVVLLADIVNDDAAACDATAESRATQGPGAGGGGGGQGIFIPIDIDLSTLTATRPGQSPINITLLQ
jgi:hypothetical protein